MDDGTTVSAGSLPIGSLPSLAIANQLPSRAPDKVLRPIIAVMLAIVELRLAF